MIYRYFILVKHKIILLKALKNELFTNKLPFGDELIGGIISTSSIWSSISWPSIKLLVIFIIFSNILF